MQQDAITVGDLIKLLQKEDENRRVRQSHVLFDDHDKLMVIRGRTTESKQVREKEKEPK
jgi:uncharacterized pyridoxamine 5'-phosphate oxidase family protein